MRHHPIIILRDFIMATVEFQSGTLTPLREGGNGIAPGRDLQINRLKALMAPPNEEPIAAPVGTEAPAPQRRPGMAARWKGLHRLTLSV